MKRIRSNKGFTAIELMVTIGIIAIIAAIGIPSYAKWIPKYKLGRELVNLKADLERAKMTAKRENICVDIIFIDNAYTVFRNNGSGGHSCNTNLDDDETIIAYQKLSPGITFGHISFAAGSKNARFRGNGVAKDGHITLKSYNGAGSKKIIISMLGRIRIE